MVGPGFISIHASAREATYFPLILQTLTLFQSTPPRGRRPAEIKDTITEPKFQSTPPRGRRRSVILPIIFILCNFNPRLREGGDKAGRSHIRNHDISIHASAREATALITKIHLKHHISFQHTVHKSPFNVNYPFQ